MRDCKFRAMAAFVLASLCATPAAGNGDLDPGFGSGGVALSGINNLGPTLTSRPVVQSDGKILVCGYAANGSATANDFYVARFTANGQLDTGFNFSGRASVDFAGGDDQCTGVAVQTDGKIVLAGFTTSTTGHADFALARLNSDGTLTRDGKIVLAGTTDISTTNTRSFDMALLRLNDDGAQDSSFGINGKVVVPIDAGGNSFDFAYGVAEQSNGKLVVAGNASVPPSGATTFVAAARLNADGSPDAEFGSLGKKTFDFGLYSPSSQTAFGVAFQGARIVVAGLATVGANATDLFVARLQNDLIFADGFE